MAKGKDLEWECYDNAKERIETEQKKSAEKRESDKANQKLHDYVNSKLPTEK